MADWTDPKKVLGYVQSIAKQEEQLTLIDTEYKPKISEKEARYLQTIADLKAWADKQAELTKKESKNHDAER